MASHASCSCLLFLQSPGRRRRRRARYSWSTPTKGGRCGKIRLFPSRFLFLLHGFGRQEEDASRQSCQVPSALNTDHGPVQWQTDRQRQAAVPRPAPSEYFAHIDGDATAASSTPSTGKKQTSQVTTAAAACCRGGQQRETDTDCNQRLLLLLLVVSASAAEGPCAVSASDASVRHGCRGGGGVRSPWMWWGHCPSRVLQCRALGRTTIAIGAGWSPLLPTRTEVLGGPLRCIWSKLKQASKPWTALALSRGVDGSVPFSAFLPNETAGIAVPPPTSSFAINSTIFICL